MGVTKSCQSQRVTSALIWLSRCSFLSPGQVSSICRVCLKQKSMLGEYSPCECSQTLPAILIPLHGGCTPSSWRVIFVSLTAQQISEYVHPGKGVLATFEVITDRASHSRHQEGRIAKASHLRRVLHVNFRCYFQMGLAQPQTYTDLIIFFKRYHT